VCVCVCVSVGVGVGVKACASRVFVVQGKDTKGKDESSSLPETIDATESKLTEVKKAKADAIENEDYDKAQELKKEQEALAKHLAQLKEKEEL